MKKSILPTLELILASAIWGFAFVAQRKGNESLHPLMFNAVRFAIGAVVLLPWVWSSSKKEVNQKKEFRPQPVYLGMILFVAASLQQIGMLWTGAGSAGFITGLYVVFVPLIGLFRAQRIKKEIIMAILFAITGLWLINHQSAAQASFGNFLVLVSAVFWAVHVQYIDKLSGVFPSLELALGQYAVCSVLSMVFWLFGSLFGLIDWQGISWLAKGIRLALLPLLYGGLGSVGIAYTLQLHAQKKVAPAPASIILCMEAVFAMIGGSVLLGERVSIHSLGGAAALFGAMLISVWTMGHFRRVKTRKYVSMLEPGA